MSKQGVPPLASPDEFAGKVAAVTGGTSGLGLHLVETLAGLGTDVFFCGLEHEEGKAIAQRLGSKAHFVAYDLAEATQARHFIELAGALKGRLDYLVNNAAIDPRVELCHATVEDFDRLIAVNLRPHFITAQAATPLLEAGTGKSIVNLTTTNYMAGSTPFTIYNASKSGIVGFTRSLAREIGPLGIRANCVCPGWIMTERQLAEHVTPADKDELLKIQALKFLLSESHVTPLTLFLLSRASIAITGQNIIVDGGRMMQ